MDRKEARAATESHPVGQVIRAQQSVLHQQQDYLYSLRNSIEDQIVKVDDQIAELSDRYQYLSLCLERGEDYSEDGYKRFVKYYQLSQLNKKDLAGRAKLDGINTRGLTQEEIINSILDKAEELNKTSTN